MQAFLYLSMALGIGSFAFSLSDLGHSLIRGDASAQLSHFNGTLSKDEVTPAAAYVARVKIVDFDKCDSYLASDDLFYKGIILNSYGYSDYSDRYYQEYTSVRLERSGTYSSSIGVVKFSKQKTHYHTWEWLQLPLGGDIRNKKEPYFTFWTWNGLPQMYFPILSPSDAGLGGKKAYMLHVYPDASLMDNISTYSYYGNYGFLKYVMAWGAYKRMKYEIYPQTLLKTITSNFLANPTEAYDYYGVDKESLYSWRRTDNCFTNVNQKSLRATSEGGSTERLCGYYADVTLSFSTWRARVQKVLTWF